MRDETEITQSFEPLEPPPPPAEPPPGPPGRPPPPPPPPPPGPPRALIDDVWPWLALLLLLAVAGLLVWLFVLRDHKSKSDTIPAVVGMPQQQAFDLLQKKGCSVRAIIEPANRPRGIVVSQAPSAGTAIGKQCVATLHISNGRPLSVTTAPATTQATTTATTTTTTSTTTATQVAVPDVTGQDMVTASGQIEAAGFVPETQPVESTNQQSGQIVAQDPPAGTQAPAGSTVVLQVAVSGQQPVKQVPNVLGQKAAAARQTLLKAGFTVKTETKKSPANRIGIVIAQRPAGGATQPQYSQVTITVGS
jgi:beta-lactam-binding protein with PASTA domain